MAAIDTAAAAVKTNMQTDSLVTLPIIILFNHEQMMTTCLMEMEFAI